MTKHSQDRQMAAIRNLAVLEQIQHQLDSVDIPVQEEREEYYDTGTVRLTSKILIQRDTTSLGRNIYCVKIQTWIGGMKHQKVTLNALLTKRTGQVYQTE